MGAMLVPILTTVASAVVGKMLAPKQPGAAPAPTIAAPPVMPTTDSAAAAKAQADSIARQLARGGRQSTILSDTSSTDAASGKLGG